MEAAIDRSITYTGEVAPNTVWLGREKAKLVAQSALSKAILGTGTAIDGLGCTPSTPASLSVIVASGSIYSLQTMDASAFGDLGTDSTVLVKQGLLAAAQTLTLTAPTTSGYSQTYLIQAAFLESDTGSTQLPYYNAANPQQPFAGPANSGISQNVTRQDQCVVSLLAGAAAATGTQVTPSATAGYTPLYTITLVNGQTSITSANIVTVAGAPFIPVTLPNVPLGVQAGQWVAFVAGGSATAYTGTLNPIPTSLTPRMEVLGAFATANTGTSPTLNLNGLGALPILKQGGGAPAVGDISGFVPLILNSAGSAWIINGLVASDIGTYIAANFIISTAITIQIGGTTPAASTSGYPNYFATLPLAQNWLSQYRISSLGSVLLQFPGGSTGNNKIPINTSINFTHPDGVRITVSGATPTGTTPNNSSLQMTGNSASQRTSDNAANLSVCRSWLATELFLTNGSTVYFGSQINVQNLLFNCDGSKNAQGQTVDLVDFNGGGLSTLTNCAFFNASHYGFAVTGGALLFTFGTIVASGCAAPNIVAVGNGTLSPQGPVFSYSSGVAGVMALGGGEFYSTPGGIAPCYAKGNVTSGFYADLGTIDLGDGSVTSYADYNSYGYYAYEGSRIYASLCEASNNSNAGWYALNGSYVEASNTSGSGNGNGFYAANQSGINRTGTTATGSTQASPAVGSVGNGNSYIS